MLAYVIGVVLFALAICLSVALHEAGHMVTARMFGMRVRRYFVGFGPTVFSFRRGETEYGLKAIPLGGFCDIAGMTALDEVTAEEAPRAMWRFKAWKRTVVMSAGSITHFLLGFIVLFVMAATMGLPNVDLKPIAAQISDCVQNATTVEQANNPVCKPGDPAPAKQAGILPGDQVLSVAGKPTPTWDDMVNQVQSLSGPVPVVVKRDGVERTFTVDIPKVTRPTGNGGTHSVGAVGIARATSIHYSVLGAFGGATSFTGDMFARTWDGLMAFPKRIPAVFNSIFGAQRDPDTPVSVVGASRLGGEAVEAGLWQVFLLLLASLNFFIGVFNLLPLLPMDGGHIAIVWYERVRDWLRGLRGKPAGGPVDYTKLSAITMVLVVIGGGVTLLTVTADIVNPIRLQ
ncbi:M50 family metallopeptidase [Amycolatopsis orientalis]|uniref:M50 family metallopeptidase n=1 Tax=Amycolatopsis orientalis TaxID=31958 RepID=UPI0003A41FE6|nr:site-2 protease family protein [Amycolatopsis orientalis]